MGAQNSFKGKYQEGTFANGEGPIKGIEITRQEEEKGVLGTNQTSGRKLSSVSGRGDGLEGRAEEKGFDLYSASYAGPQNLKMKPVNKGETPNYEVNK